MQSILQHSGNREIRWLVQLCTNLCQTAQQCRIPQQTFKWVLQTFIAVAGNFCIDWDSNSICRIISWSKWTHWVLNPKWRKRLQHFQNCILLQTLLLSDFHSKNATLIWHQKKVQSARLVSNFWEQIENSPSQKNTEIQNYWSIKCPTVRVSNQIHVDGMAATLTIWKYKNNLQMLSRRSAVFET